MRWMRWTVLAVGLVGFAASTVRAAEIASAPLNNDGSADVLCKVVNLDSKPMDMTVTIFKTAPVPDSGQSICPAVQPNEECRLNFAEGGGDYFCRATVKSKNKVRGSLSIQNGLTNPNVPMN